MAVRRESIVEALAALASEQPRSPAVMWATDRGAAEQLTWPDLYARACRGAATLLRLNPQRSRVGIAAMNSVDWIVAMYACAAAGMSVVPIRASCTDDEARFQIDYARVGIVLAAAKAGNHRVLERLTVLAASMSPELVVHDIAQLDLSDRAEPIRRSPDDEFLIQYTSGTTGRPKAASISHGAALNSTVFARAVGLGRRDRLLNPLPLHHVGGSLFGLISALAAGCASWSSNSAPSWWSTHCAKFGPP
nr:MULTISPECIES: AMP-binding protein [unclassified Mycolicibacterium]